MTGRILMAGDPAGCVQIGASVGHSGQSGVPSAVADQAWLPELSDQRVPTGRVPQGGGGDHAGTLRCYGPSAGVA